MAISLLSAPTSHHQNFVSQHPCTTNSISHRAITTLLRYPTSKSLTILLCSSSSSSVVQDGAPPSPPPPTSQPEAFPVQSESSSQHTDQLPLRGCKACGREEIEKGCNGEGRIQGGIATVPGFGWWPIKAYRPCPGFIASGGRYRRQGQSMDEVAFGRGERATPVVETISSEDDAPSKKRRDPRKFKR